MVDPARLSRGLRLVGGALTTAWALATVAFFAVRLAPGDPTQMLDASIPPSQAAAQSRLYGLDRSLSEQYGAWLGGLVTGDLGWSYDYRRPVSEVLGRTAAPTLLLTGLALALQYAVALTLALAAAGSRSRTRFVDALMAPLHAVPTFWIGLLALSVLARRWPLFPEHGARSLDAALQGSWVAAADALWHAALPAAVLGLGGAATIYRLTVTRMAAALRSPHALAARARGVGEARIRWVHALRTALGPAVQRLGLDVPALVGGALTIEVVFSRPGLGRAVHRAFLARDIPLLAAGAFAAGLFVVAGSALADWLTNRLDPRGGSA